MTRYKIEIDVKTANHWGVGLTIVPAEGLVIGIAKCFIEVYWRKVR